MALYTVSNGSTIAALDINQIINVLQKPAAATETGAYYLGGWGNAAGDVIQCWIPSLSRNTAPVSVSVNTSISAPSNINAPTTGNSSSSGFQLFSSSTGANVNCNCAGVWTIQY